MKKIMGFVALMALLPSAQGGELSTSAEYRLRYQVDQEMDGKSDTAPSSSNAWKQRFKLGSTFRSGEKLTAQLTLLHNATWGHSALGTANGTGDSGLGLMDGVKDADNMVLVNEAYGSWMASDEWLIRFGRGALNMADGRVIGVNDWESSPYSFEGVLFTWDKEFARFNAYGVKFAELTKPTATASTSASDPEINSYGLSVDWKSLPEFLKMVNFHVIQVNVDNDTTVTSVPVFSSIPKESRMRYGLVVSGDAMNIDYRLTYAAHTGKFKDLDLDRTGSMIDAELGYRMPDWMNSRFSFLYHTDSGDKDGSTNKKIETYDSYFYEKHENAGWMDVFAWGNLTYMQLRYTMDIMDDLSFAAQYLIFSQTAKEGSIVAGMNGGSFSGTGDTTKDALGTELDLAVAKKYEGGLVITARAGMFSPGDEYKAAKNTDTYTQFFLEGKMNF